MSKRNINAVLNLITNNMKNGVFPLNTQTLPQLVQKQSVNNNIRDDFSLGIGNNQINILQILKQLSKRMVSVVLLDWIPKIDVELFHQISGK